MSHSWGIEEARSMLKTWLDAEKAVAVSGQSYRIGTRQLTRANLPDIVERIKFWRNELAKLEDGKGSGARVFRGVPRDF